MANTLTRTHTESWHFFFSSVSVQISAVDMRYGFVKNKKRSKSPEIFSSIFFTSAWLYLSTVSWEKRRSTRKRLAEVLYKSNRLDDVMGREATNDGWETGEKGKNTSPSKSSWSPASSLSSYSIYHRKERKREKRKKKTQLRDMIEFITGSMHPWFKRKTTRYQ